MATRNDITVSRDGGSSARAVLEEGTLSVQDPPDGIGRYDESTTLSLADDTQPEPIAYWRLHLGTYDGARYPSVRVLLHRAPELIPSVLALREGDLIRLTGLPPWVAYGPVDLLVTGWSETMLPRTWEITFTCVPAGPWMTAKANHVVYGKVNTDGSALAGPITATDTAISVRITAGPPWTTDPQETPFEAQFGGEVARVDTVGQLLSTNPWMESDLTGWVGQVTAAVTYSTAVHHPRAMASAMVTPTGSASSNSFAMAARSPGVAGQSYTACFWVYSPTGWADFRVSLDWFTSAGAGNGTTSGPVVAVPAGTWTFLTFTATAPAGTASMVARCRQGATPPVSSVYHVWGLRLLGPGGAALLDTFGRTVAGGWGSADTGQTWTATSGTIATDYAVNGSAGQQIHTTKNTFRISTAPAPSADTDLVTEWSVDKTALGDANFVYLMSRYTDTTHFYFARVQITQTAQAMTLTLRSAMARRPNWGRRQWR
ncbi:hypothetical protein ACFQ0Q_32300 [Streptomyces aureus]